MFILHANFHFYTMSKEITHILKHKPQSKSFSNKDIKSN